MNNNILLPRPVRLNSGNVKDITVKAFSSLEAGLPASILLQCSVYPCMDISVF